MKIIAPFKIKDLQNNKGSEFQKFFQQYIQNKEITHFWNYPHHLQFNAKIETLNRA